MGLLTPSPPRTGGGGRGGGGLVVEGVEGVGGGGGAVVVVVVMMVVVGVVVVVMVVVRVRVTMKTREVGEPRVEWTGGLGLRDLFVHDRDEGRMVPGWQ